MRRILLLSAVALWLPVMDRAAAAEGAAPCGCEKSCARACCKPSCHKVCRVVCEMKKVEKTVWVVECEEFCVPNPSCCRGGCGCGAGCEAGCCKKPCGPPPQCGPVRCRKTLVKKTITCEVPVYKCVVVGCGCGEGAGEPTKADELRQVYLPAPLPTR